MVSILASVPSCPGFDLSVPEIFSKDKIIDVAEFNQWRWFEEKRLWLENVDQTHLVPTSGKPVLQKIAVERVLDGL